MEDSSAGNRRDWLAETGVSVGKEVVYNDV